MATAVNFDVYVPTYQVKIEGQELSKAAVLSITVDESLDAPTRFEITMNEGLDPETQQFTWLDNPLLNPGHVVEIFLGYVGKKSHSLVTGKIKALSPGFQSTGIPTLSVEGYDFSHDMQAQINTLNDCKVAVADIARQLATLYHLKITMESIESLGKYLLSAIGGLLENAAREDKRIERQVGESDYAFLRRLAGIIGFEFFVQRGILYFRSPKEDAEIIRNFQYRQNFLSFSPRLSMTAVVHEVVVYGHNQSKKRIEARANLNTLAVNPNVLKVLRKFMPTTPELQPLKIEDHAITSPEEAQIKAEVALKKAVNTFIQGTMACIGDPELRPGIGIQIDGIGTLFSGKYYVTTANHTFNESGYRTTLGVRRIMV